MMETGQAVKLTYLDKVFILVFDDGSVDLSFKEDGSLRTLLLRGPEGSGVSGCFSESTWWKELDFLGVEFTDVEPRRSARAVFFRVLVNFPEEDRLFPTGFFSLVFLDFDLGLGLSPKIHSVVSDCDRLCLCVET